MPKKARIPAKLLPWIEARKKFRLSHAQVQMARELGLNPGKFGSLANHREEPWKLPLPLFIEHLYRKSYGKDSPDRVQSIEERVKELAAKKAARRERRLAEQEVSTVSAEVRRPVATENCEGSLPCPGILSTAQNGGTKMESGAKRLLK